MQYMSLHVIETRYMKHANEKIYKIVVNKRPKYIIKKMQIYQERVVNQVYVISVCPLRILMLILYVK